jgi:hypothetical protein
MCCSLTLLHMAWDDLISEDEKFTSVLPTQSPRSNYTSEKKKGR